MEKDYQRMKYHKDLLQPIDNKGKRNEEFYKTYGENATNKQTN